MMTGSGTALAGTASLADLGILDLTNQNSTGQAVSDNGDVVIGYSNIAITPYSHAFYWTPTGGMIDLGVLGGVGSSLALGLSDDGSVVVGGSVTSAGPFHAFRWTQGSGMVDLGTLWADPTATSGAYGVNADGSIVVGAAQVSASLFHAFRWTQAGGMIDLGALTGGDGNSELYAISDDGTVAAGDSGAAGGYTHAIKWDQINGIIDLGTINGFAGDSNTYGISSDGLTIVGSSDVPGFTHAMMWTEAGGIVDLGTVAGVSGSSYANAVSGDGAIIVGQSNVSGTGQPHAFRWTAATGMADLNALLATAGVDMTGIELSAAKSVSTDGQFIVGKGRFTGNIYYSAFLARYIDAAVAGLTTASSIQNSVDNLAGARAGIAVQMQGFGSHLLGNNAPLDAPDEVGAFGAVGSISGGVAGKVGLGDGFSLLGGLSINGEEFKDAKMRHATMGALAVRYVFDKKGKILPFVESGGWVAPDGSFTFSRRYTNGAASAVGVGETNGSLGYFYMKAGVGYDLTSSDTVVLDAEIGHMRFHSDAYDEPLTVPNPFNAHISSGTDRLSVAKAAANITHDFTPKIDATLSFTAAHGFAGSTNVTANVAGFGIISSKATSPNWAEYGLRAGYKLTANVTLDAFVNGISGNNGVNTETHAGADIKFSF